jgi:membrane associated rhomboid family serine protease
MQNLNRSNKGLNIILAINVIFFVLINIVTSLISINEGDVSILLKELALNSNLSNFIYRPWTLITSMFLHLDFFHILFNMLYLYMFGSVLSSNWNGQSVVSSYVLGGLLGAFFYIFLFGTFFTDGSDKYAIGASGGVMSVMATTAILLPNYNFNLLFFGKVKLKWIFIFIFILTNLSDFDSNLGGKIDHFGGAVFGVVYALFLKKGINLGYYFDKLSYWFKRKFNTKKNKKNKIENFNIGFRGAIDRRDINSTQTTINNILTKKQKEEEINFLLDKIKKIGYNNLSEKEKEKLIELSENYD